MRGAIFYSVHKLDYNVQFSARATLAITVFPDSTIRRKGPEEEVKLKGAFLHVASPKHREPHVVKRLVLGWYREKGRVRIVDRFKVISARFEKMGCQPPVPIFRSMPRRWGSLSSRGRISLNPDLIRAPTTCIDYVITHELVHLIHSHHGPAFYELLETLMPDWRRRKERLERALC
jgi:predicted metal-dependent hydrolase